MQRYRINPYYQVIQDEPLMLPDETGAWVHTTDPLELAAMADAKLPDVVSEKLHNMLTPEYVSYRLQAACMDLRVAGELLYLDGHGTNALLVENIEIWLKSVIEELNALPKTKVTP